jgi:hypothetical protein
MGAVRVVVAGNLPIGCAPAYLSGANVTEPAAYDADGCLAVLNGFAELYNAALRAAVAGAPARRRRVRELLRGVRQGGGTDAETAAVGR